MSFLDRADSIAKRLERLFSGATPTDPLYVSNRTSRQKVRFWLLVGTPITLVLALLVLVMLGYFDSPNPEKVIVPKANSRDLTAKVLPNLDKDYKSDTDRRVEVTEAVVVRGADSNISGRLRNNSDQNVMRAEVVFDVTDEEGSALGAVAIKVENIAAHATVPFRQAIEQHAARAAIVREVNIR